jgi:hypothetical protein
VVRGINAYDESGIAISAAGDINGDGRADLLIGATFADRSGTPQTGEGYVVFGNAQPFPAAFELSSLLPGHGGDGSAGFVLAGIDAYDFAGRSVSAAGDINGDGMDDLVVGADFADPGSRSSAGECYVIYGRDTAQAGNFPARIPLESLLPDFGGDGRMGFVINGNDAFDQLCHSVAAAGDVNGDGIGDLVIGAFGATRRPTMRVKPTSCSGGMARNRVRSPPCSPFVASSPLRVATAARDSRSPVSISSTSPASQ